MSTLKRFFKDTAIYGIAAVLPRALNILLVNLKTTVFEPDEYSVDTKYYVYAAYFNALLTYGMETAFFRFFTKEKEKGKVLSTSFITITITTFIFLGIALFFANQISAFIGFSNPMFFKLLLLTLFFDTLVVIPYAYLRVSSRPMKFTFFKVSNIIVYVFLAYFFLLFAPKFNIEIPAIFTEYFGKAPQVIYIFFAGAVASLVTFLMMLPILFKFSWTFDKAILKKLLIYGLPIMVGSLAFVTNENFDKIILENIKGKEAMGIYAACYKLGVFMTLFIMAFRMGAEPFFFNQADKANAKESYATILTWFTIIGSVFMFVIVGYINLFAKLIGKESYLEALAIVPIILLANLFLGIYNNLSIWYKLTDKTKYGMYISIFGAVLTIVLNILLIPTFGYIAAAWVTLLVYASMTLISYYLGKKHYPVPYNLSKVGLYLLLSVIFSFISFRYFRGNYFVSSIILVVFLGIVSILEKKNLKNII
ncbi:MAG: polysaccharide biosynthesis C-terminal domain-containing protein [Flavobacteriaceae bacterium]